MARKSRRIDSKNDYTENKIKKEHVSVSGVYLRISSKDTLNNDSIHNQRSIVDAFLESRPEIKVFKYYIDEGVSSYRNFRPAFEEMMNDIKIGLIDTVIVKDISRFGRNYMETGTYLETIFPRIGVRFISICEDIDSVGFSDREYEIAIKSLINHFYSQDISIKVKSVIKQKQLVGDYVAARVPYGYKKSAEGGKTHYVLDQDKAKVVMRIFDMALKGSSYYQIAGELNNEGIKSPGSNQWTVKAVSRVINNRFYTGTLETGKTENTLGGVKLLTNNEMSDWIVIVNHHEALINSEIFDEILRIRTKNNRKLVTEAESKSKERKSVDGIQKDLFGGLLYCGDCGRKMKKQIWADRVYYVCPKYGETKGSCSLKSWREGRLIVAIKSDLQDKINSYENRFKEFSVTDDNDYKNEKIVNLELKINKLETIKADLEDKKGKLRRLSEAYNSLESSNEDCCKDFSLCNVLSRINVFDEYIDVELCFNFAI